MKVLIDGYNLVFECGLHGKRVNADSLAKGRQKLLRSIVNAVAPHQLPGFTVVFDAQKQLVSGQREQSQFEQIRVLYSINHADADEMIEHLIRQHSAPKQLTVVSSDHRIQKAARRRKARSMDSGKWYDELLAGRWKSATSDEIANQELRPETLLLLSETELDSFQDELDREKPMNDSGWFDS